MENAGNQRKRDRNAEKSPTTEFDSKVEVLESLLGRSLPADAEFPVSFGFAGVNALGRKDPKSGGGSVQRTWLGNVEAALEYADAVQELIDAIAPIPEGYKKQKFSRIGFLLLKDLGQYCDPNCVELDEVGQIVWDGDRPKVRSVDAMDIRSYAIDILRPKLEQAALVNEVEAVSAEVDFSFNPPSSSALALVDEDAETIASRSIERWGGVTQATLGQTSDLVAQALDRVSVYEERAVGDANSVSAQTVRKLKQLSAQEQQLIQGLFQLEGAQSLAQVEAVVNAARAHGQQVRVGKLAEILNQQVGGSADGSTG